VKPIRLAMSGASGTGKTTLASYAADLLGLPQNPVGSRSVSEAMGFASPYDVDRAGRRAEFQRRLLAEKIAWERDHDAFVTDRTTLDVLAYFALHDVASIDSAVVNRAVAGAQRYTHVAYCPVRVFQETGDDPVRVDNSAYHHVYGVLLEGLIDRHIRAPSSSTAWTRMLDHSLVERKRRIRFFVGLVDT
jgi:AAA domain